jgi:hypothetical protein
MAFRSMALTAWPYCRTPNGTDQRVVTRIDDPWRLEQISLRNFTAKRDAMRSQWHSASALKSIYRTQLRFYALGG